jgi:hypothetical protein
MERKELFKRIAITIFLIFILNFIAGKFYWYYTIWYFDIFMHIFGGFFIALLLFWFLHIKEISLKTILKIIFGVFIIGVSWEIFEIVFNNIIAGDPFNILDTVSDIFCDLAGSCFAITYFYKKINFKNENKL